MPLSLRKMISSPNALFVFEAVTREMSFTSAARELNVTPPAVSRMIAGLEDHLGVSLFNRRGAHLSLTDDGVLFKEGITSAFQTLGSTLDRIEERKRSGDSVSLSLSTAVVTHWLVPKIRDFQAALPEVTLYYELTGEEPHGPIGLCDLGMRFGPHAPKPNNRWDFAPEWVFAVASPSYIAKFGSLDEPKQGEVHTLVSLNSPRLSWKDFSEGTGVTLPDVYRNFAVPDYSVAIQTALSGNGIALGFVSACSGLLLKRELVSASKQQLRTGDDFVMVASNQRALSPSAEKVLNWFLEKMRAEKTSLERMYPTP